MPYIAAIPAPVQRTAADGVVQGNSLVMNSTGQLNYFALADELKGGLHFVEYYQYLNENSWRGVSVARRRLGMLAFVWKNATLDGSGNFVSEEIVNKFYYLQQLSADGAVAVWAELETGGGGGDMAFGRVFTVADIAGRNALQTNPELDPPLQAGDMAVVVDASGDGGLIGGATYIWNGSAWVRLLFPGDPNSHIQHTDNKLVYNNGSTNIDVTAQAIWEHLQKAHLEIDDNVDADTNYTDKTISSDFLFSLLLEYFKPKTDGDGSTYLDDQGNYTTPQLSIKRIDGGRAASTFE